MKIGLLVQGIYPFNLGGHEIRIREAGKRLSKRHEVHIYLPSRRDIDYPEEFEGMKIHPIDVCFKNPSLLTSITALEFAKKASNEVQGKDYDIIDVFFYTFPFKKKKTKVVASTGAFYGSFKHRNFVRKTITAPIVYLQILLNKMKIEFSNKVVSLSDMGAKEAMRHFDVSENQLRVIKNGVSDDFKPDIEVNNLKKKLGFSEDDFIIAYSGRLEKEKGIPDLFQAIGNIQGNNIKALILGEGKHRKKFEKMAKELGVEAKFTGAVDHSEVPRYLNISDLFVLPSYWEIQPLSCIEAMACGIPVISTEVGGIPEIVKDGENGILVPPGNPSRLAKAITMLKEDKELRRKLSKAGLKFAQDRTWDNVAQKMENLYEEIMEKD